MCSPASSGKAHLPDLNRPTDLVDRTVEITGVPTVRLFGPGDRLLKTIEQAHPRVRVHARGNELTLTGGRGDVAAAERLVLELVEIARSGVDLEPDEVLRSSELLATPGAPAPSHVLGEAIVNAKGRVIRPKTLGQKRYVDAIDAHTVTFGIGPAGTGKTYLAMAKAVQALQRKEISRLVLTRPAVEAGERLGFLPGNLTDKIDPYLRPLFDALGEMLDPELVVKLMATNVVEVAPLAYMRGRTLSDAFVILDEAQNTTPEQMRMFLTRLGFGSRMVVTGDITQVDLPHGVSGLRQAAEVLDGIEDIAFMRLTSADVVRHNLVAKIVDAYSAADERSLAGGRVRQGEQQ